MTMRAMKRLLRSGSAMAAVALMVLASPGMAQLASAPVHTGGALLPVQTDASDGRILLTLPAPAADGTQGRFLYAASLKTGLGSAPIRLDHGMLGDTQVLAFRRLGKKVAVTFENPRFTARGGALMQKGARESFPYSVIAMLDVASGAAGGGVTVI
jgi:hypothetical protein